MSDRLITKKEMEVLHNILYDLKYNNFDFLLDYQKFNSSIRRFDFCMRDLKKFENIPEMEYHFKNKRYILLEHAFISNYSKENLNHSKFIFKELDTKIISENRDVFDSNYIVFVNGKVSLYPTIFCLENKTYLLFDIDKPILPYEEKSKGVNTIDFHNLYNSNAECTILFLPNANRISGPTQVQDIYKYSGKIPFEYDRYKATDINNVDARRFNYLTFLSSPNTKGMVLGDVVNDNGKFVFDLTHFDRLGGRILLDSVCIPNIVYEKTIPKGTRCFTLNELDMPIHTDNILVFKRDKYNNKIFDHKVKFELTYPNIYSIKNFNFKEDLILYIIFEAPNANQHSFYDNFMKKFIQYNPNVMKLATMGVLPDIIKDYHDKQIIYDAGDFDKSDFDNKIDYMTTKLSESIYNNADFMYRVYDKFNYDEQQTSIFDISNINLKRRVRYNDRREGGNTDFNKKCYYFSIARKEAYKDTVDITILIDGLMIEPDFELDKVDRKIIYIDSSKINNDSIFEIVVDVSNKLVYTGRTNSLFRFNEIDMSNNFNGRYYHMTITDTNDELFDTNQLDLELRNHDGEYLPIDTVNNRMVDLGVLRYKINDIDMINTDIRFVVTKSFKFEIKEPHGINSLTSLESDFYNNQYIKGMYDIYINGRKTPNTSNYTNFGGNPFTKRTIVNTLVNRNTSDYVSYVKKPCLSKQLLFMKEIPINGIVDLRNIIDKPLTCPNLQFYLNGRKLYSRNIEFLSSRVMRIYNVDTIYNLEIMEREIINNYFDQDKLVYFSDELYDLYKDYLDEKLITVKENDIFEFLTELDIEHIDYTDKHIEEYLLTQDKFIDCESTFELDDEKIKSFPHMITENVCIVGDSDQYLHNYRLIL